MNEKYSLISSIAYVYLRLRGEQSHELYRLLSNWLSLPKVTLHFQKVEGFWTWSRRWSRPIQTPRSLSLTVARVAGNRQLSIEINGIVSLCHCVSLVVWTGLSERQIIVLLAEKCWDDFQTHHENISPNICKCLLFFDSSSLLPDEKRWGNIKTQTTKFLTMKREG